VSGPSVGVGSGVVDEVKEDEEECDAGVYEEGLIKAASGAFEQVLQIRR
jgi:hypothetical protein